MKRDDGASLIETILLGLLFLVPVIWALGVLSELHRSALAATAAAREGGFEAARATTSADASRSATVAIRRAFLDHGLDPANATIELSAAGLERGEAVEVEIGYPVSVLQAPVLGRVAGPSIWIRADHVARIDPYRSRP
jgi:non-ribosomal peptide synthetase component F